LDTTQRQQRSHQLCQQLVRSGWLLRACRLAVFYSQLTVKWIFLYLFPRLWQMHKRTYLPVIPGPRLWFQPYGPQTRLLDNCYGIPEPRSCASQRIALQALDMVLMPLVAFDLQGNRIGMGGGFYDRSFAYLRQRQYWRQPRLIGVGFQLQLQPRLHPQQWDVPLDGAVTENGFYSFRP